MTNFSWKLIGAPSVYQMRPFSALAAASLLGLARSLLHPAPVNYLRATRRVVSCKRTRTVGHASLVEVNELKIAEVEDDIRAAQRRFADVARIAEVTFYGKLTTRVASSLESSQKLWLLYSCFNSTRTEDFLYDYVLGRAYRPRTRRTRMLHLLLSLFLFQYI